MIRSVVLITMVGGLAGSAAAQGITFSGPGPRTEYSYPANPQYQYPYPYHEPRADSRGKPSRKCPHGQVRHQGQCKVARPLALPF